MSTLCNIAIMDCTKTIYNEKTSNDIPLGGIERCIINLSRSLFIKGYNVRVFSNVGEAQEYDGIIWHPKNKTTDFKADIVIACNDSKLFDVYEQNSAHKNFKPFLWHHNPIEIWKTIRKGRFIPLIKWNPTTVFLGQAHFNSAPRFFIPSEKNIIIEHGIEDSVLNTPAASNLPPPHFAYISQAYRGLEKVISLWKELVYPQNQNARLYLYCDFISEKKEVLEKIGIYPIGRLPRKELIQSLSDKRAILIPGHKDETFCLSAKESLCLGIPVITLGIGCLKERVKDSFNGFIVENNYDFAQKIHLISKDDKMWNDMSKKALMERENASWDTKAEIWVSHFRTNR
jgi:glycosyltransferase involved in cell wall biosynthesis